MYLFQKFLFWIFFIPTFFSLNIEKKDRVRKNEIIEKKFI